MRFLNKTIFLFLFSTIMFAQNNPGPRFGHSMVVYDGKIYLFGGAKPAAILNKAFTVKKDTADNFIESSDLFSYTLANGTWQIESPLTSPPKRKNHSANVWNGKMVVYGGDSSGNVKNDLWNYDFLTKEWTQMPVGGTPPPVADHSATVTGNILVIAGGRNQAGLSRDSVEAINLENTSEGFTLKHPLPEPLQSGGMYNIDDVLYFVGGIWHDWDSSTPGNQPSYSAYTYRLCPVGSNWTAVSSSGFVKEAAKYAGVYLPERNEYYLIGGEKYNYTLNIPEPINVVSVINTATNYWNELNRDSVITPVTENAAISLPDYHGLADSMPNQYSIQNVSGSRIFIYGELTAII